ncbi:MAG: hypothetical protein GX051_03750 [Clostridiales bacterium]|nr:hypothetical protein [Clostridiales bacterium]
MFDWLGDLLSGIGDAISGAFQSLWEVISNSIWDIFLKWIYEAIYGAIADFFTMMGNMGANMFNLPWVVAIVKLFSMFGWALFVAGLVVAVFDTAIEYQSMGRVNIKRQIMPVLYGFLAVNLFTTVPIEMYKLCLTLQNLLSHDLSSIFAGYMNPKRKSSATSTDTTSKVIQPKQLPIYFQAEVSRQNREKTNGEHHESPVLSLTRKI